jgi:hypothetical protein
LERRNEQRVNRALAARVWAVDARGDPFSADCTITNISSGGVYARVPGEMQPGGEISLAVWLSRENGAIAGLRGLVLRSEPQPDGSYGVAVVVTRRELL